MMTWEKISATRGKTILMQMREMNGFTCGRADLFLPDKLNVFLSSKFYVGEHVSLPGRCHKKIMTSFGSAQHLITEKLIRRKLISYGDFLFLFLSLG